MATAVTTPAALTVAAAAEDDFHVTSDVRSALLPSPAWTKTPNTVKDYAVLSYPKPRVGDGPILAP